MLDDNEKAELNRILDHDVFKKAVAQATELMEISLGSYAAPEASLQLAYEKGARDFPKHLRELLKTGAATKAPLQTRKLVPSLKSTNATSTQ